MPKNIVLSWSGGKDSALALYKLQKKGKYKIVKLLTTITKGYLRVSIHGIRYELLLQQCRSLGFNLESIFIAKDETNKNYSIKMRNFLRKCKNKDIWGVSFGDIFLEEVRKYRLKHLYLLGMQGIFPLWKRDTLEVANNFIDLGFKAIVICVDSKSLDKRFIGRCFNRSFLADLPSNVDPCGENGEFHTFVFEGPMFKYPIKYNKGKVVFRDSRFYYLDLIPIR
ncbi:MAG: diphthine--ammonia ligase [Candidatus Omnitrophica bacterium]|jgi:uncharacterized protein (TIGR00290 family)|nr:diphthine--ammonia ligase [Candidatus Omnitrophota bacterium]